MARTYALLALHTHPPTELGDDEAVCEGVCAADGASGGAHGGAACGLTPAATSSPGFVTLAAVGLPAGFVTLAVRRSAALIAALPSASPCLASPRCAAPLPQPPSAVPFIAPASARGEDAPF